MYVLSGFIVARSRESRHRTRELFWLAQLMNKETLSMLTDLLGGYAAQDFLQQLRISWSVGRSPSSRTARITGCGESAVCSGIYGDGSALGLTRPRRSRGSQLAWIPSD